MEDADGDRGRAASAAASHATAASSEANTVTAIAATPPIGVIAARRLQHHHDRLVASMEHEAAAASASAVSGGSTPLGGAAGRSLQFSHLLLPSSSPRGVAPIPTGRSSASRPHTASGNGNGSVSLTGSGSASNWLLASPYSQSFAQSPRYSPRDNIRPMRRPNGSRLHTPQHAVGNCNGGGSSSHAPSTSASASGAVTSSHQPIPPHSPQLAPLRTHTSERGMDSLFEPDEPPNDDDQHHHQAHQFQSMDFDMDGVGGDGPPSVRGGGSHTQFQSHLSLAIPHDDESRDIIHPVDYTPMQGTDASSLFDGFFPVGSLTTPSHAIGGMFTPSHLSIGGGGGVGIGGGVGMVFTPLSSPSRLSASNHTSHTAAGSSHHHQSQNFLFPPDLTPRFQRDPSQTSTGGASATSVVDDDSAPLATLAGVNVPASPARYIDHQTAFGSLPALPSPGARNTSANQANANNADAQVFSYQPSSRAAHHAHSHMLHSPSVHHASSSSNSVSHTPFHPFSSFAFSPLPSSTPSHLPPGGAAGSNARAGRATHTNRIGTNLSLAIPPTPTYTGKRKRNGQVLSVLASPANRFKHMQSNTPQHGSFLPDFLTSPAHGLGGVGGGSRNLYDDHHPSRTIDEEEQDDLPHDPDLTQTQHEEEDDLHMDDHHHPDEDHPSSHHDESHHHQHEPNADEHDEHHHDDGDGEEGEYDDDVDIVVDESGVLPRSTPFIDPPPMNVRGELNYSLGRPAAFIEPTPMASNMFAKSNESNIMASMTMSVPPPPQTGAYSRLPPRPPSPSSRAGTHSAGASTGAPLPSSTSMNKPPHVDDGVMRKSWLNFFNFAASNAPFVQTPHNNATHNENNNNNNNSNSNSNHSANTNLDTNTNANTNTSTNTDTNVTTANTNVTIESATTVDNAPAAEGPNSTPPALGSSDAPLAPLSVLSSAAMVASPLTGIPPPAPVVTSAVVVGSTAAALVVIATPSHATSISSVSASTPAAPSSSSSGPISALPVADVLAVPARQPIARSVTSEPIPATVPIPAATPTPAALPIPAIATNNARQQTQATSTTTATTATTTVATATTTSSSIPSIPVAAATASVASTPVGGVGGSTASVVHAAKAKPSKPTATPALSHHQHQTSIQARTVVSSAKETVPATVVPASATTVLAASTVVAAAAAAASTIVAPAPAGTTTNTQITHARLVESTPSLSSSTVTKPSSSPSPTDVSPAPTLLPFPASVVSTPPSNVGVGVGFSSSSVRPASVPSSSSILIPARSVVATATHTNANVTSGLAIGTTNTNMNIVGTAITTDPTQANSTNKNIPLPATSITSDLACSIPSIPSSTSSVTLSLVPSDSRPATTATATNRVALAGETNVSAEMELDTNDAHPIVTVASHASNVQPAGRVDDAMSSDDADVPLSSLRSLIKIPDDTCRDIALEGIRFLSEHFSSSKFSHGHASREIDSFEEDGIDRSNDARSTTIPSTDRVERSTFTPMRTALLQHLEHLYPNEFDFLLYRIGQHCLYLHAYGSRAYQFGFIHPPPVPQVRSALAECLIHTQQQKSLKQAKLEATQQSLRRFHEMAARYHMAQLAAMSAHITFAGARTNTLTTTNARQTIDATTTNIAHSARTTRPAAITSSAPMPTPAPSSSLSTSPGIRVA